MYNLLIGLSLCFACSTFCELNAQDRALYREFTSQQYNGELRLLDSMMGYSTRTLSENVPRYDDGASLEEVTIPVVVHVLFVSERDRVSEAQVLSQLNALNECFASSHVPEEDIRDPYGDFRKRASDTGIRFCLADTDPAGHSSPGINYRQIALVRETASIKQAETGIAAWAPENYLNIWVCSLPEGNSGFAQSPGGKAGTDGIVIDPRYFGVGGTAVSPFDEGKTLVHLIGSYLGLNELWSRDGCGDDGVDDTPVHNAPNFGTPGAGHHSSCDGYPLEMTMNYMDNSDDSALYMFTRGQAIRMRSVLGAKGLRSRLTDYSTRCTGDKVLSPYLKGGSDVSDQSQYKIELSPNPTRANTKLTINHSLEAKDISISVVDLNGQVRYSQSTLSANLNNQSTSLELPTDRLSPGVYLVSVSFAGSEIQLVKRLIVVQ